MADDLNFQQLSTVSTNPQISSKTIAAAATIAPTTFLTVVTGTTQVATITPPTTGWCTIALVFTNGSPGATLTSGNIQLATTVVQYKVLFLVYNPLTAKWYPSY